MSLFKKKPQMPAQGREQVETDFEHHTIIHHLLYAYPDDYTSCGAYPDYSSSEYFSDVLAKAEEAIKSLDLDETTTEGFTEMVKLKAYQSMLSSLVETPPPYRLESPVRSAPSNRQSEVERSYDPA